MKKLLLTLATGLAFAPGFAQSKVESVVFVANEKGNEYKTPTSVKPMMKSTSNSANKGTAVGGQGWFSYLDIMYNQNATAGYYSSIYQDSNLQITGSSGNFYNGTFGNGVSFDPTDSVFFAESSAGTPINTDLLPEFRVTSGNAYTIDSVAFNGRYYRKDNTHDDSLYVEVTKTQGSSFFGTYALQYQTPNANFYQMTPDGKPRFATAIYNKDNNRLSDSITTVVRMGIKLDAAFHADSNSNGNHPMTLALPTPLSVNAGEVVIVFISFKNNGTPYPLGTNIENANTFRTYTYELYGDNTWLKQTVGSYQTSLTATKQNKYYGTDYQFVGYQGHNTLLPAVGYTSTSYANETPDIALYVNCSTCPVVSVPKVKGNILSANAYPNPATAEVRVPFTLKAAANVNVTITNTVGQVVKAQNLGNTTKGEAVISVSDLSNGVYFYTVDADGQRQTGRVVVNH